MFREMRRFKQQIPEAECIQILKEQPRGVLSMLGDDNYPYGIPMDHWYCEENGRLYFPCFIVVIRSVIIFGRMHIVDEQDDALRRKIAVNLCRKFTDDEAYLQNELVNALPRASFLELIPEHMTGKLVNES